jgi:hypothetical protein
MRGGCIKGNRPVSDAGEAGHVRAKARSERVEGIVEVFDIETHGVGVVA